MPITLFFSICIEHDQVASVLLSTNQSKVKTLTERRGVDSRMSSRVAQGSQGWSPLFLFSISLPLILFKDFFIL